MPTRKRNHAYGKFNFLVDLGTGDTEGPQAAFQECNISIEVTVPEFHSRNKKENSVRKITGLNKSTDVTFKRGVIGSMNLFNWLNDIRNGNQAATRDVTIQLQSKDHRAVVQTWRWRNSHSLTSGSRWNRSAASFPVRQSPSQAVPLCTSNETITWVKKK